MTKLRPMTSLVYEQVTNAIRWNNKSFLTASIKRHLTPSLLLPKYRGQSHPLAGHCYVASEAYYHLAGGQKSGLKPMQINHEGVSHWFLLDEPNSQVIDITAEQFGTPVPYAQAKGKGFLTKNPSKRTQKLLDVIQGN